jgi:hypothetical protein
MSDDFPAPIQQRPQPLGYLPLLVARIIKTSDERDNDYFFAL